MPSLLSLHLLHMFVLFSITYNNFELILPHLGGESCESSWILRASRSTLQIQASLANQARHLSSFQGESGESTEEYEPSGILPHKYSDIDIIGMSYTACAPSQNLTDCPILPHFDLRFFASICPSESICSKYRSFLWGRFWHFEKKA